MYKGSLCWGRPRARKRKRAKKKEMARAKAKTQRIMKASTQERMRLRTRSRRMTRMIVRMRAKCEKDGAEVFIHVLQNYISHETYIS